MVRALELQLQPSWETKSSIKRNRHPLWGAVRCWWNCRNLNPSKSSALCRGIWWNLYRVGFASKHIPWQFDCPYGNHNVVQIWKHASQKIMEDTFLSQNKVLRRRKSFSNATGSQDLTGSHRFHLGSPGPLEFPLFKRRPIFEELWCTLQWSPAGDLRWWSQPHKVLLQLGPSNPRCGAGLKLKKTQKRHEKAPPVCRTQF